MCTALERARWSVWDQHAVLLPRNYVDAVQRAGGLALLLPPDPRLVEAPERAARPARRPAARRRRRHRPGHLRRRTPHPQTQETVPERDAFEIALTRAAIERDLPVLGICRGMQLINVALGGTPDPAPARAPRPRASTAACSAPSRAPTTTSTLLDGLARDARDRRGPRTRTKSHHHQGVDRLGEGLRVSALSPLDELLEAIELPERALRARRAVAPRGRRR